MLTLTIPIGPDLVASLTASAAAAGLPVDEHAENLLRGALGLPGYPREGVPDRSDRVAEYQVGVICGPTPPPRVEEVSSALHKSLKDEISLLERKLQNVRDSAIDILRSISNPPTPQRDTDRVLGDPATSPG